MGRWGHRLFEADQDLDIAVQLNDTFKHPPLKLSHMIDQTDMAPGQGRYEFWLTDEYQAELAELVPLRVQLDSGLGDRLFETYRARENEFQGKYRVIIAGTLMVRAGSRIKPDDSQHLRDLVPQTNCSRVYTLPLSDDGFRAAGRAQFLAALDNYVDGTPRDYQEPSCFTCGKVKADLGFVPMKRGH